MNDIADEDIYPVRTIFDDLSKAIELDPNRARAYYERGLFNLNRGGGKDGFSDFDKAIKLDPNFAEAYNGRGSLCVKSHGCDKSKAIADFDQAIKLNPNYADAYYGLGNVCGKDETDKAIAYYTQAIKLDPNYANAYEKRAEVYYRTDNFKEALADAEKVCKLAESGYKTLRNRGYKTLRDMRIKLGLED
ncbi:MAG: tetratricopeptide repeat protein [Helicobacteraceae bacterium]|nr:tetratricopeptide repeat protein [Helicobacteraceae bacterium]